MPITVTGTEQVPEHAHDWYFDHTYEDWWDGDSDDIYYCSVEGCPAVRRDYVGR